MLLLAAIAFGALGPVQRVHFADKRVRAEIRFRIAPDRDYNSGPAAVSPSIAAGSLTFVAAGHRRVYDISRIFPIAETRIVLPLDRHGNCGATVPLTRTERYLVVEAIVAQKGCSSTAAFIDLDSGEVAENVVFDPAWERRFDALPERFDGSPTHVTGVDLETIVATDYAGAGVTKQAPWHFVIVRTKSTAGATRSFAMECSRMDDVLWRIASQDRPFPKVGSHVFVGSLTARSFSVAQTLSNERVLHLDASDELRYAVRQSPTPPNLELEWRKDSWFAAAGDFAQRGDFDAAVDAYANLVRLDRNGSDASAADGDTKMLERCRVLQKNVHAKQLTARAASAKFVRGC